MNEAKFIELLGAYGADLRRWPEAVRAEAESYLDSAPHRVRDVWESERSFDNLLAIEKDVFASSTLEAAILSSQPPRRRAPVARLPEWRVPQWAAGGALAACLALGFAVGYANEPGVHPEADYAKMLTVSGGGAGSVFLAAMNDVEN